MKEKDSTLNFNLHTNLIQLSNINVSFKFDKRGKKEASSIGEKI